MAESVFRILFGILVLAILLPGCAHVDSPGLSTNAMEYLPELQKGERLLKNGDASSASAIFLRLDTPSKPKDIRLRARYGLAVAALISARNLEQFNEALALWRNWAEKAESSHADPRFLEPLLPRLSLALPGPGAAFSNMAEYQPEALAGQLPGHEEFIPRLEGQFENNARIEDIQRQLAWSERERGRLAEELKTQLNETVRKNLELSDENLALSLENQRLRERQITLSLESERLQQQLKALEQLHLEINRKKKVVE